MGAAGGQRMRSLGDAAAPTPRIDCTAFCHLPLSLKPTDFWRNAQTLIRHPRHHSILSLTANTSGPTIDPAC